MNIIAEFITNQVAHDRGVTITYPAMKVQFQCPVCGSSCEVSRSQAKWSEETGQCVCTSWYTVDWQRGKVKHL